MSGGHRRMMAIGLGLVGVLVAGCSSDGTATTTTAASSTTAGATSSAAAPAPTTSSTSAASSDGLLTLDTGKDYGDKYADGILPVGDGDFVTDAAKVGSIFLCRVGGGGGGADTRGPWFSADGTTYDINKKVAVSGEVHWDGTFDMSVSGGQRIITTNDLPHDHTTGEFPIAADDEAHQYDRNPNSIAAQSLTYTLPATPTATTEPSCMGGESGVMLTGVALFNGFDAGNRDAGAWEVQDGCDGHPQVSGEYHYHTLSSCITDTSVHEVIGFALDGFPITGPTVGDGNVLTTADLDECHGIVSDVTLDGATVTTYHYVMTEDFPYSVSCFRAAPTKAPGQPG